MNAVKDIRVSIVTIVMMLICFGFVMIYSSSGIYAQQEIGDSLFFLKRHAMFFVIGLISMLGVMMVDCHRLPKLAKPMMLITLLLLALVLVPGIGRASFGARRWFNFGPFNFQPSELAKITIMIYAADYLARKRGSIQSFFQGFFPLLMVMGVTCSLIVLQPDLGNSILVALLVMGLLFLAGARIWHMMMMGVMALPLLIYLVLDKPYRVRRIMGFLNPWEDSLGAGFQLVQSQIALGSGGVFGVGPGQSLQKLFYLPAAHTDFIFSIIGEELGLVGTLFLLLLFAALIWQGARLTSRLTNPFAYYLSSGIVMMIGFQATVNIGVSIGALPTKGLPLPFISYGGSALIFNMMAIGLLLNLSRMDD
jgi:cell division protein FtsW